MPLRVTKHDFRRPVTQEERVQGLAKLLRYSAVTEAGCWHWQRGKNTLGYGETHYLGERWMAHRMAWVLSNGATPPGMFVCHRCDNPACVNTEHLFIGDHTANQRDMIAKNRHSKGKQTHCKRGHPLTGENVGAWRDGHRECVACQRGRIRIKAGWPEHLAFSLPKTPSGKRPFGRSWKVTRSTVPEVQK